MESKSKFSLIKNDCTNSISEIVWTGLKTIKNFNINESSRKTIVLTMKTHDGE